MGRIYNGELLFNGYRVPVLEDGKFWKWMVVMYTMSVLNAI